MKEEQNPQSILPPELLLEAYSRGIFPMAQSRQDPEVEWFTAYRRGIIPMDRFHVSRKVRRLLRNGGWVPGYDTAFEQVIEACADRPATWISEKIIRSFIHLHRKGFAHSVEVYRDGRLAGGLYGVTLGAAFFAESMFQYQPEASKIALYYCHRRLQQQGFELWDVQFHTGHLAQFGCTEIPASEYEQRLELALEKQVRFNP